jgi:N-acetylmuramoyl-L-alanine amidase
LWLVTAGFLASPASAQQSNPAMAVANGVRIGGDEIRTRFVVDIDRPVDFRVFILADPYRVIIDLPQITFDLPANSGQQGRGLISAFRYGLLAVGQSRIVLDATSPVFIDRSFVLPPQDGQPGRLVVDLIPTDRETFMRRMNAAAPAPPPSQSAPTLPPPPELRQDNDVPLIVIDPGHGGIDSGTVARNGAEEKNIVLAFAKALEQRIESGGAFNVVLTRDTDIYIPLADRVEFARDRQAALFISIHADSFRVASVRGATVYTVSEEASDQEAAALAATENKSDIIAGLDLRNETDDVSGILIDLAMRETKNYSIQFARSAVDAMRGVIQLNRNPHRFAGFRVLKAPDVPSVLIELGYLSNASDVRDLQSRDWRDKITASLFEAVKAFFDAR